MLHARILLVEDLLMSEPTQQFGDTIDYSTWHISGQGNNGAVFTWEDETIQRKWEDGAIVYTRLREDGSIAREIMIGDFFNQID